MIDWILENVQLGTLGQWVEAVGSLGVLGLTYRLLRKERGRDDAAKTRALAEAGPDKVAVGFEMPMGVPTWIVTNHGPDAISAVTLHIDAMAALPSGSGIRSAVVTERRASLAPGGSFDTAAKGSQWAGFITVATEPHVHWSVNFTHSDSRWARIRSDLGPRLLDGPRSQARRPTS